MAQVPKKLINGALALMLLPMTVYSFYLSWDALHEGERLVDATDLPVDGGRTDGKLYRIAGVADGTWLNPPEIPEVQDALEFNVYKERQGADGKWTEIPHDYPRVSRVEQFRVKNVPVKLGKYAIVAMPDAIQYRDLGGGDRLVIALNRGKDQDLVVYGYYAARMETGAGADIQRGGLADGNLGRLLVMSPDKEAETIQIFEKAGRMKAAILGGAGLLVLLLMAYALRRALR